MEKGGPVPLFNRPLIMITVITDATVNTPVPSASRVVASRFRRRWMTAQSQTMPTIAKR